MIYYISGGERSGKSSYAQQLALTLSDSPTYVATARIWDDNFNERIQRHTKDRDHRWTTIEEEKEISKHLKPNQVYVIDCVTLWLTNFFVDTENDIEKSLASVKEEFKKMKQSNTTLIIISNEIGMGLHAQTEVGRKFTELQGWTNQHIAKYADKATFMVSGLPILLK